MRTRDGIRLMSVINYARSIGVEVRDGGRHPFVLNYTGMRPCPVAGSNTSAIYSALRTS